MKVALAQRMSGKHIPCNLLPHLPQVWETASSPVWTHMPSPDTHTPDNTLLGMSVVLITHDGYTHICAALIVCAGGHYTVRCVNGYIYIYHMGLTMVKDLKCVNK